MSQAGELIVSVSGVRGIVGRGLTPEVATSFASALGTALGDGRVVISRDGRPSGLMLRHAVLAGLAAVGCDAVDVGVAPTPTCGLAVRRLGAAGAVQITASHNPAEWNGLKLFGKDGRVLPAAEGRKVQARFEAGDYPRAAWDRLGAVTSLGDAADWHRDRVLELLEVPKIYDRRLPVFLDANGGAGGPLGRALLEALGCRVTCRGCDADGRFVHEPEPTEPNLRDLGPEVARAGCAVGFVLDPDADRLALLDESGRYIGEELTLALAASFRLRQERGPVVVNLSTSRVTQDVATRLGCAFYRSAVGEANVADKMQQVGAVLGGEGNGGVIDPRVGYVRDPFIGMGLVLNLLAATGRPLGQLADELPAYVIVKDKYAAARERLPALFASLEKRWPEAAADRQDGLRLDWPDRWVHVRPSNTEPIVRVIAEAPTADGAQALCQEVGALLRA